MRLSSRVLIGEEQLRLRVEAMAQAIALDTPDGRSLSVIALMDGAFMFCADLVRRRADVAVPEADQRAGEWAARQARHRAVQFAGFL